VAVGFLVPVVDLLTQRELERHDALRRLGPDPLAPAFDRGDAAEIARRVRARGRSAIGGTLLNQGVVAGIGNVLRSEILFLAGIDPARAGDSLSDAEVTRIVDTAHDLLAANVMTRLQTISPSAGRRTTRSLDPGEKLWVYGRGGRPCRRCGAVILSAKTDRMRVSSTGVPVVNPPSPLMADG
jgi:endonuclease VIII